MSRKKLSVNVKLIIYAYICLFYMGMIYYYSYKITVIDRPLGWFFCLVSITLALYLLFVIGNLFIPKRIISRKKLVLIDFLLLMSLIVIDLSEAEWHNRLSFDEAPTNSSLQTVNSLVKERGLDFTAIDSLHMEWLFIE